MRRGVLAILVCGLFTAARAEAQGAAAGTGTSTGKPAVEISDAMIAAARSQTAELQIYHWREMSALLRA